MESGCRFDLRWKTANIINSDSDEAKLAGRFGYGQGQLLVTPLRCCDVTAFANGTGT